MQDRERVNQLEVILSELIHSNEISERRIYISEKRLEALEKLQYIVIPVLTITGAGTLFGILKLFELF